MSKQTTLDVNIRAETGKNGAKKVIAAGKIPSVIYGLGEQPLNISIDKISFETWLKSFFKPKSATSRSGSLTSLDP